MVFRGVKPAFLVNGIALLAFNLPAIYGMFYFRMNMERTAAQNPLSAIIYNPWITFELFSLVAFGVYCLWRFSPGTDWRHS